MPAQKYISKMWQWHFRVQPPKIYPYCISLTKYIFNQSTLEHNLNRFWKLQFRATTFVVPLFLEFGHVTTLPMTYSLDSDRYNHIYVPFLHFLVKTSNISLFEHLPLDPECITQQYWPALLIFFWFFPYYTCFWSRDANVSISGNACWTLETVPSQHHHQSITIFFWFFLYFIAIFHPEKHCFLYLEVCTGPWNSTHPSPVMTTIPIFFAIFSPFYWYFHAA